MSHCILTFRGDNFEFNEDYLTDGMAIAWHLLAERHPHLLVDGSNFAQLRALWKEHDRVYGGCGILQCPFDEWFQNNALAVEFIRYIDIAIGEIRSIGPLLPFALVQSVNPQYMRYNRDYPVENYVAAVGQLRGLIHGGLKKPPVSSEELAKERSRRAARIELFRAAGEPKT